MDVRSRPDRSQAGASALRIRFAEFVLDEAEARLARDGAAVSLAPKAFAVLCALARQPGRLMTKDALLDAVWGHQFVSESVLKTTISELRAALADEVRQPRYIETVARRGYRFIGEIGEFGAAAPATPSPLPARATTLSQPSPDTFMIGRQPALARLRTSWDRAVAGARQVVWIAGEAGIGKTTLIDAFAGRLGPVACAQGQCVEQYGAGEPYLPVLEALGALCRSDAALPPLLRAVAPAWLLQLPWLSSEAERAALRRELAGAGPDRMLREFGELVDRCTQDRPLLLVTEDLHWSDHATVQLINHIARRRSPARLMWLSSFRLAEVIAEDHPLKALRHELRLHRLCDEIVLEPFSEQEIADYIAGRDLRRDVPEALVRALHARTDGLPLFVVNMIDDLVAQGVFDAVAADAQAAEQVASRAVPENLAGVLEKQIARLAPDERILLEAASVCGVEFRPATVAAALERDPGWAMQCCDELARNRQWLMPAAIEPLPDGALDARYAFRHALYRHVFYQRLGALAQAKLHRRTAVILEQERAAGLPVTAAVLASHYDRGREPVAALRHYADAAENALRHFAPADAVRLTDLGADLLPRCPQEPARIALELALAALRGVSQAQVRGVSSIEAKQAFERALALLEILPQHPLRSMVLHGLGLVLYVRGEYVQARALGERCAEMARDSGDPVLQVVACDVLGQTRTLQGWPQEGLDHLQRGIAAGEAAGDAALHAAYVVDPMVTMWAALAMPLLFLGRPDEGRAQLDRALTRAQRLKQPMAKMVALWFAALFELRMQNPVRVGELAAQLRAVVDEGALAQGEGPSLWYRGWADAHAGDPIAGFRLIRQAYEHNTGLGMLAGGSEVLGYAAEALVLARDWAGAQTQVDEALQHAHRLEERIYVPQLLLLQGRIADGRGDAQAARAAMLQALAAARQQQAAWQELSVLAPICERDDAGAEDFAALAAVLPRVAGGADTPLVAQARARLARRARRTR